jgi:hypothetical protein
MKVFFYFLLFGISLNVNCQQVLEWVNLQYMPNLLPEQDYRGIQAMHNQPKEVFEQAFFQDDLMGEALMSNHYVFDDKGNLSSLICTREFLGDVQFNFKIINGFPFVAYAIYRDSTFNYNDTSFTTKPMSWDEGDFEKISDENGNIVFFKHKEVAVYSQFDNFNRKILDSIPKTFNSNEHVTTYTYKRRKIIKTEVLQNPEMRITSVYKLDKHFNWIEESVKLNGLKKRITRIRLITYD